MTEEASDKTTNTTTSKSDSCDSKEEECRFVLPEVRDRAAFLAVFEGDAAFEATRTRMRDDMVASLQCLAPLAERVRAQSFLALLTGWSAPSPAATESFESLGEALPPYVAGIARTLHGTVAARGVKLPPGETAHILLDWLLQPFFSKFVPFLPSRLSS